MNAKRLAAIIAIFVLTSIAWMILGGATQIRSVERYTRLGVEGSAGRATVQQLWGHPQEQSAPVVWTSHIEKETVLNEKGKKVLREKQVRDTVALSRSRVNVGIDLHPRRKGLLWYSTYKIKFGGDYQFKNGFPEERKFYVKFVFPDSQTAYDNVLMHVGGNRVYPAGNLSEGMVTTIKVKPGQTVAANLQYGSQGLDTWQYRFGENEGVASVRDFEAAVKVNTKEIDFPEECLSPTDKTLTSDGWDLRWKYGDLISGSNIGIAMPQKLNPGPFASRLSYFAPICLLFFFAVLLIVGAVKDVPLHPMHYLLLAATFFSFHLLFSYMVDHVTPFYAFLISSAVSLLLTISYLRLVVNWRFAVLQGGLWQCVFLVLFTYAFFFEGFTGLTITIGAIVTLAVLMQMTGRVNWEEKLAMPRGAQ